MQAGAGGVQCVEGGRGIQCKVQGKNSESFGFLPKIFPFFNIIKAWDHQVHIPIEHSVCRLVRIGTPAPTPSLARECAPPPPQLKGEATHSPAVDGVGGPNSDDWRKSLGLCLPCAWDI